MLELFLFTYLLHRHKYQCRQPLLATRFSFFGTGGLDFLPPDRPCICFTLRCVFKHIKDRGDGAPEIACGLKSRDLSLHETLYS